jgi:hypothetical protein
MDNPNLTVVVAQARLEQAQRAHQEAVARIAAFYASPEWLAAAAEERRTAAQLEAAQLALTEDRVGSGRILEHRIAHSGARKAAFGPGWQPATRIWRASPPAQAEQEGGRRTAQAIGRKAHRSQPSFQPKPPVCSAGSGQSELEAGANHHCGPAGRGPPARSGWGRLGSVQFNFCLAKPTELEFPVSVALVHIG